MARRLPRTLARRLNEPGSPTSCTAFFIDAIYDGSPWCMSATPRNLAHKIYSVAGGVGSSGRGKGLCEDNQSGMHAQR